MKAGCRFPANLSGSFCLSVMFLSAGLWKGSSPAWKPRLSVSGSKLTAVQKSRKIHACGCFLHYFIAALFKPDLLQFSTTITDFSPFSPCTHTQTHTHSCRCTSLPVFRRPLTPEPYVNNGADAPAWISLLHATTGADSREYKKVQVQY